MYEKQFGLSRKPFRANAAGADVYTGTQAVKIIAGVENAFAAADSVIAVTGEPGVGKTTLVNRAIDSVAGEKQIIHVSRMQLGHDETLEYLLEQMQAVDLPRGTIRKINLLRDLLAQRTSGGTRVVVIIEDAVKIGEDALVEFESLTAADGGGSDGANVILMGDESLLEILRAPALRRLQQRARQSHTVQALTAVELEGYLTDCFRNSGAEFERIFADGAAQMIYDASQGNPRVANNLVMAVLASSGEQGSSTVENETIVRVASREFGITVDAPIVAVVAPEPAPEPEPESERQPTSKFQLAPEFQPDPTLELKLEPAITPAEVARPTSEPAQRIAQTQEIPTLFATTRIQAPLDPAAVPATPAEPPPANPVKLEPAAMPAAPAAPKAAAPPTAQAAAPKPAAPAAPKPAAPAPAPAKPTAPAAVKPAAPVAAEPAAPTAAGPEAPDDKPAWDRDPTLAQLRPDFEALEEAMADFKDPDGEVAEQEAEAPLELKLKETTLTQIPAITLDVAIEQKISEAQEALEKTDVLTPGDAESPQSGDEAAKPKPRVSVPPLVNPPPAETVDKADSRIERIAAGLAAAKSLEDVDDQLAETLFGEELNLIAAQVAASRPDTAGDDTREVAVGTRPGEEPKETPKDKPQQAPQASTPKPKARAVHNDGAAAVPAVTQTSGGLDLSASKRLATVRALNSDSAPAASPPPSTGTVANPPAAATAGPKPIEDQISTSMTQTLKVLGTRPTAFVDDDDDDDDDDEETKGGFFSRFRRS